MILSRFDRKNAMHRDQFPHRRQVLSGFAALAAAAMLHRDGLARTNVSEFARGADDWHPPEWQTSLYSPKQRTGHLAVHERRRQSHGELRSEADADQVRREDDCKETPYADATGPGQRLALERLAVPDANGNQRNDTLYPLQVGYQKHGQSGIEVSDWFPHIVAKQIDEIRRLCAPCGRPTATTALRAQFHSGRHHE
jgi:hypothetical protein